MIHILYYDPEVNGTRNSIFNSIASALPLIYSSYFTLEKVENEDVLNMRLKNQIQPSISTQVTHQKWYDILLVHQSIGLNKIKEISERKFWNKMGIIVIGTTDILNSTTQAHTKYDAIINEVLLQSDSFLPFFKAIYSKKIQDKLNDNRRYTLINEQIITNSRMENILFISSQPKRTQTLATDLEYESIKSVLRMSNSLNLHPPSFKTKINALPQLLSDYPADYIIFAMHGSEDEGLCFEDDNESQFFLPVDDFIIILEHLKLIPKLLIFNACNSDGYAQKISKYTKKATIGSVGNVLDREIAVVYALQLFTQLVV